MTGPSIIHRPLKLYKIETHDVFVVVSAFSPEQAGQLAIDEVNAQYRFEKIKPGAEVDVTEIKLDNKVEVKALIISE